MEESEVKPETIAFSLCFISTIAGLSSHGADAHWERFQKGKFQKGSSWCGQILLQLSTLLHPGLKLEHVATFELFSAYSYLTI